MTNPLATLTIDAGFIREELTEGVLADILSADELAALEESPDNIIEDALIEAFEDESFQSALTDFAARVADTIRPQLSTKG